MARRLSLHLRPHRHSASGASNSSSSATALTPTTNTTATSTNSPSLPPSATPAKHADPASIIAASRAEIRESTRNDWEYPHHAASSQIRINEDTLYVRRTRDLLTPSPSPPPAGYHFLPYQDYPTKQAKDPYRFQDPDSVGKGIEDRRKRKRQEAREDKKTNEGLSIFEKRRDAWTGTVKVRNDKRGRLNGRALSRADIMRLKQKSTDGQQSREVASTDHDVADHTERAVDEHQDNDASSTRAHVSTTLKPVLSGQDQHSFQDSISANRNNQNAATLATNTSSRSESPTPPSSPELSDTTSIASDQSFDSDFSDHPFQRYVPMPEPLLPPTHPTRALITPNAYPSIYSRVVVQGTTPRLPIPLPDLVRACVEGWKSEGEWPPKGPAGGPEPLVGRMRRKTGAGRGKDGLGGSVGRGVRRVLRIVGGRDLGPEGKQNDVQGLEELVGSDHENATKSKR